MTSGSQLSRYIKMKRVYREQHPIVQQTMYQKYPELVEEARDKIMRELEIGL